jgi:hypothetical protein
MKGKRSKAYLAGVIMQGIILALAVLAVLAQLVRHSTELTFRYGGF